MLSQSPHAGMTCSCHFPSGSYHRTPTILSCWSPQQPSSRAHHSEPSTVLRGKPSSLLQQTQCWTCQGISITLFFVGSNSTSSSTTIACGKLLGARSPIGSKALTRPWPRRPNDRPRAKLSGRPSKPRTFGTLRLCLLQVSNELCNWKTSEPHRIAARISLQHALRIQHNFHKIHKIHFYHICHDVSQQKQ